MRKIILLILTFITTSCFSQNNGHIKGKRIADLVWLENGDKTITMGVYDMVCWD